MLIITSDNVPDTTYFTTNSAEPDLSDNQLTIYTGTGSRRSSWGQPGVTSTIVLHTENLVAIHVGYFHKHGGGQFYRYYQNDEQWQQVTWAKLSDDDRQLVLHAYENHAPSFAKVPGKLRAERNKPEMKTYQSYKLVEIIDGKYYSVHDNTTEYTLGKRLAEKAVDDHGGGYYSYPTEAGVLARFHDGSLFLSHCYDHPMELALIECEISGTIINYDNGKCSSTYIKPLRELSRFQYTPEVKRYA